MKKTRLPVFLAVFLVLAAMSASAQNYRNFQDDWTRIKEPPLSFGPFRIFPGFQLKNFGFDNNLFFENQPLRDFKATLSPEATVYLPWRNNAIFYFRDNPEYHYYVKEKRQRAFTALLRCGGGAGLASTWSRDRSRRVVVGIAASRQRASTRRCSR